MLTKMSVEILHEARKNGWVLEPDAKRILRASGIAVPEFIATADAKEALRFAREHGYPVAVKVVSPQIMHKSDMGGVVVGITEDNSLLAVFDRFSRMEGFAGVLIEEMADGIELMAGAKLDRQFGPVILFGMGGTKVEIYKDTAIRMAPLQEKDVFSMIRQLKARPLLDGYRGAAPINREALTMTLLSFSALVVDMAELIESIDLNPLFCSAERCVVGDARIVLKANTRDAEERQEQIRKA